MEEKKYEEALEKAREIYFNKEYKPNEAALVKEILAELFLELEESESERERKKIINFLDELRTKIGCCLDREECRDIEGRILAIIRWLEKVKDFDKQLEVQYKRGYEDALAFLNKANEEAIREIGNEMKLPIIGQRKTDGGIIGKMQEQINELTHSQVTKKSEQDGRWKWDEDDEKFFKENILIKLGNIDSVSPELYSKIIDWINLIKKRLS